MGAELQATPLLRTIDEYRVAAEAALPAASWAYLSTGSGTERTMHENLRAFQRWRLIPRLLVDVSDVSLQATVLGRTVAMPILVAPSASHRLFHPEGEKATARAAADAGTVFCVSAASSTTLGDIDAAAPGGSRWIQMMPYRDKGLTRELLARAAASGYEAVAFTVDTPVRSRRLTAEAGGHISAEMALLRDVLGDRGDVPAGTFVDIDSSATWADFERFAGESPIPVLPKGLLAAADVAQAASIGLKAVIISNHGGRQLDQAPATLDALPGAVAAADGRLEVIVDGGVRTGADVIKALALGATAVQVGRPVIYGLSVAGEAGVAGVLGILRDELANSLALLGCPTPADVTREHVATVAELLDGA